MGKALSIHKFHGKYVMCLMIRMQVLNKVEKKTCTPHPMTHLKASNYDVKFQSSDELLPWPLKFSHPMPEIFPHKTWFVVSHRMTFVF